MRNMWLSGAGFRYKFANIAICSDAPKFDLYTRYIYIIFGRRRSNGLPGTGAKGVQGQTEWRDFLVDARPSSHRPVDVESLDVD